jgi:hypothetical protein
VWRAVAQFSRNNGDWTWGGRDFRNSISDAEQLLCLMYPAAIIPNLALDVPDATPDDALEALRTLGDSVQIPKVLVDVLTDYMRTYTSDSGTPLFSGDTYFQPTEPGAELTKQQLELDVVDSFSMSISLALSTLGFLKVFKNSVSRAQLRAKIAALEAATSARLSAAMVGLLRSFCINVFEPDSLSGQTLLRTLNQSGLPERALLEDLRRTLKGVRASLRDTTLGLSQDDALDNDNMFFECGWSWGVVRDAPLVETTELIGSQPDGVALGAPYLYFTIVALDGISDLFSDRTRILGLLNPEQQRLAQALQIRWDVTLAYWSAIARFGQNRWPLEDIPWRTVDDAESVYFSLVVTAVVLLDLLARRATDDDLTRTVAVLEELAIRGRISRRVTRGDPSAHLHFPGVPLKLEGAEKLGPPMSWMMSDYAALLLKRATRAAGLSRNNAARERLLAVAEDALSHLWRRRLRDGPAAGLWDDPNELFPDTSINDSLPSWYLTERVIESLVIAADTVRRPPIRSGRLLDITTDLISEADHLFSQEQLDSAEARGSAMHTSLQRIETRLQRARRILQEQPGTANALVIDVLRELDEFAMARRDAARSQ